MPHLLHQSLSQAAQRWPDKVAFRCGGKSISFGELALATNRMANLLLEQGVKKGDRVGIFLPRSLDTVVAIYGILKAGAVYVPLDPFSPSVRIAEVLAECDVAVLITNHQQRRRLPGLLAEAKTLRTVIGYGGEGAVRCLPSEDINLAPASAPLTSTILEDDLAYILTTSGSTGRPKGIMHTHRSGMAYAKLMRDTYKINEEDVLGNHCAIHFDMCTLAYFTGPLTGATVVLATDAHVRMPVSLAAMIAAEGITIWYSVPLALQQMYLANTLPELDLSSLRLVIWAGEAIVPAYLRALMELLPKAMFSNHYGPAETNVCTTFDLKEPPADDKPVPIGHPWANTEVLVFDERDQPVPKGEPGILLVRSATLMQGYWKNPALTEKSFYREVRQPGYTAQYYRTGDLVRQDEQGVFHFLGRKDRQVKIRGYRVELDEVENAVNAVPGVLESAVFASPKGLSEREIHLLAVVNNQEVETYLPSMLKTKLPEFALPAKVAFVDSLPRTSGGKIDRQKIGRTDYNLRIPLK
jgi:amino acid adenylation domain-containing protein